MIICVHFSLLIFGLVVFQDSPAPDMSFLIDLIYNGFSNVLQFIGKYQHQPQILNLIKTEVCTHF